MSRTPTPPPVMENAPGATLPAPAPVARPPVAPDEMSVVDSIRDAIDDGVAAAILAVGGRDYFMRIARDKPELFHKYVTLVLSTNTPSGGTGGKTKTYQVVSPLAPSPLDDHPAP